MSKYWVIIPAAGTGQRFGSQIPKQYLPLNGKPLIEHTIAKFLYHPRIEKIVVAIHSNDHFWPQLRLDSNWDKILITTGGEQRCHSVYSALQRISGLAHPQDFVLVHDAVRPCIHHDDITKIIDEVGNHPVGGILGSRVRDTLKHISQNNEILDTVTRENIWQALTPQMFRYKILLQALSQVISSNSDVTDEAEAIESLGFIPMIVEGRRDNIKVTFPEDLSLAEKYLR
jgi:2-C-methyl-D-erythritol 4-phosphate cytidylyltransferase